MKHGKTSFQEGWLSDPQLKTWIRKIPNDVHSAGCRLCPSAIISVSSMGRRALTSHMQGNKHRSKSQNMANSTPLGILFRQSQKIQPSSSNTSSHPTCSSSEVVQAHNSTPVSPGTSYNNTLSSPGTSHITSAFPGTNSSSEVITTLQYKTPLGLQRMKKYLLNENATKAEVLWCLQSVVSHKSMRSAGSDVSILKLMFPDSEIAQKIELQRTKLHYTIVFGIATYFKNELLLVLRNCNHFVIGFDESLNKVSQRQQMDLVVRFWEGEKVNTRYLGSTFLTRCTAIDLLEAFQDALKDLDMKNLIQVSMDGPNVNFSFLRELKVSRNEDGIDTQLLDLGSCGLHTVHCAFKAAIKATQWDIVKFLRSLYFLFKDFPSRRGAYIHYTGSDLFPMKFCEVRWLENGAVAQRAIDMVPNLEQYVAKAEEENKVPASASFVAVKNALNDPLLRPKLAFFKTLSADVEPFLNDFQTNWPFAPFLHSGLLGILTTIKERIVRPDCMNAKVDINVEDNLLNHKKINVGFSTLSELKKCRGLSEVQNSNFRRDCKLALKRLINKLEERSPLKLKLVRCLTCFDPSVVVHSIGLAKKRLEGLLEILVESHLVSGTSADRVCHEFNTICSSNNANGLMVKFKRNEQRLDEFWMKLVNSVASIDHSFKHLKSVLQIVMILSHGNAELERGFSVNRDCLIENLKEETLTSYRIVYDTVQKNGGVANTPITKSMLNHVGNASSMYRKHLEKKRQDDQNKNEEKANLKRKRALIKELQLKKAKVLQEMKAQVDLLDNELKEAESKK